MQNRAQKYTFETSFDTKTLRANEIARLQKEKEGPLLYTEKQHQEQLAIAKHAAYEEGVQKGSEDSKMAFASEIKPVLLALSEVIQKLAQDYHTYFENNLMLAATALQKSFPQLIEKYEQENLKKIILDTSSQIKTETIPLNIHMHPERIKKLQPIIEAETKDLLLNWVGEAKFTLTRLEITWDNSGIEKDTASYFEIFLETLHQTKKESPQNSQKDL